MIEKGDLVKYLGYEHKEIVADSFKVGLITMVKDIVTGHAPGAYLITEAHPQILENSHVKFVAAATHESLFVKHNEDDEPATEQIVKIKIDKEVDAKNRVMAVLKKTGLFLGLRKAGK